MELFSIQQQQQQHQKRNQINQSPRIYSTLNLDNLWNCISFKISQYFMEVQQFQLRARKEKSKTEKLRKK